MADDIIESVRKFYDGAGGHFSRTRQKTYGSNSTNWPVTDKYIRKLNPGESVLDLGCGNGRLVSGLPEGVKYLGIDFSKTLLSEAKSLYPDRDFRFGNVVEPSHWKGLPIYEAIFCVAVLHHIPEHEQQVSILSEAGKHLKKGAFLYLTVWNLWQERYAQYQVDDHFEMPYNNKWKRYCVAFDVQTMTDLMTEAGLDVQEIFYADCEGKKSDIMAGQNLVCVAM